MCVCQVGNLIGRNCTGSSATETRQGRNPAPAQIPQRATRAQCRSSVLILVSAWPFHAVLASMPLSVGSMPHVWNAQAASTSLQRTQLTAWTARLEASRRWVHRPVAAGAHLADTAWRPGSPTKSWRAQTAAVVHTARIDQHDATPLAFFGGGADRHSEWCPATQCAVAHFCEQ